MKPWVILISIFTLVILIIISVVSGFFDGWSFFAVLFYLGLYIGGYVYVKIGMNNRANEYDKTLQKRQKFDWCWERVNQILKSMPGGQGIEWAGGVGRKSAIKSFFNGVQNKPFRSLLAHLENTQQLVLIIFDIEGDDIADFITNPKPDLITNPFINFKPFGRSGGLNNDNYDRFGRRGYRDYRGKRPVGRPPSSSVRSGNRGVHISVDNDGYGDLEKNRDKVTPDRSVVDNAVNKLKKKKRK